MPQPVLLMFYGLLPSSTSSVNWQSHTVLWHLREEEWGRITRCTSGNHIKDTRLCSSLMLEWLCQYPSASSILRPTSTAVNYCWSHWHQWYMTNTWFSNRKVCIRHNIMKSNTGNYPLLTIWVSGCVYTEAIAKRYVNMRVEFAAKRTVFTVFTWKRTSVKTTMCDAFLSAPNLAFNRPNEHLITFLALQRLGPKYCSWRLLPPFVYSFKYGISGYAGSPSRNTETGSSSSTMCLGQGGNLPLLNCSFRV